MNIIVIGSSTGGPRTLETIFTDLPRLDAALLVVQHMPRFANPLLCKRLSKATDMEVKLAEEGERIMRGIAYLAPSEIHMDLVKNRKVRFFDGEKVNYVKPSIDVTMMSMRKVNEDRFIGVVLTGIGRDGADGISHIKKTEGTTIAQDQATSAIYGMPKKAAATGDVDFVLSPEEIKKKLIDLVGVI